MSAQVLVRDLTWIVYLLIFLYVGRESLREPRRTTIDIALFFGLIAFVIILSVLSEIGFFPDNTLLGAIIGTLVLSVSYVLLRLVDDFARVPPRWLALAGVVVAALCLGFFVFTPPRPAWLTVLQVTYFVGVQIYAAIAFLRASHRTGGVTQRRMRAAAMGSGFLGLTIFASSLSVFSPEWGILSRFCGLASGASYFLGFATPPFLRRAWQEPELRAFLGQAATLPRLPTTTAIIRALQSGAAASVGAPRAAIGLWYEDTNSFSFDLDGEMVEFPVVADGPAGRSFLTQQPIFVANLPREVPALSEVSRKYGSTSILAAPITAGQKRLGVLTVYADQAPIFARDDLALVQLLADQAAVILESRALIDEAARVQAREEATRMKDDFLSAAAHDLKSPLTTLVARAQLLERRALRAPDAPADLVSIRAILAEAQRLKTFVLELLDATRAERGQLVGRREEVDLRTLIEETVRRRDGGSHTIVADMNGPAVGAYDPNRIRQLLENLLENAVKYSPENQIIEVKLAKADGAANLSVTDHGIGIPPADLTSIFDRFYRGTNVDDRRFAGLGLGLYICRGIVEQHGGQIWATSRPGEGTTIHMTLPTSRDGAEDA